MISLRKLIILSVDELLKNSFTDFALKYFMRIRLNSMHVMRKCLTAKSALQETQKGGCLLVSKYAWVPIFLSPAVRL